MFHRCLAAVVVLFVVASIVVAGTYEAVVTKISDKEIVIKVKKDKDDKKFSEEKKLTVNKDTKFYTKKGKDEPKESSLGDVTKAVEKAVDNEKNPFKGARATIETEGEGDKEVVTKVTIRSKGK